MTWDPYDHASEEERNDWAVRSQLYVQRELERDDDSKEKVRRMLAAVVPKTQVCYRCRRPGVRMLAVVGEWVCARCDPLRPCSDRVGSWRCNVDHPGHGWPHRHSVLDPENP